MKKFYELGFSTVFAPKMNEICSKPWIAAVSSSMQKIIPFILTGSVIYFYNVFRSYLPALPDLGMIADYSFGLISLIPGIRSRTAVYGKAESSVLPDQLRYRFHGSLHDVHHSGNR